jgi:hypothetical protein
VVLDVVAEDPEDPHVSEQVGEIGVQEQGGDEAEQDALVREDLRTRVGVSHRPVRISVTVSGSPVITSQEIAARSYRKAYASASSKGCSAKKAYTHPMRISVVTMAERCVGLSSRIGSKNRSCRSGPR